MSAPLMLLHASTAATKIADLRTHLLRILAAKVKRLKSQPSELHFISQSENDSRSFLLDVIMKGAMAAAGDLRRRGGHIIFCQLGNLVHRIHGSSFQLRRVSRSSSTAEILAAADAMYNRVYIKTLLNDVNICHDL